MKQWYRTVGEKNRAGVREIELREKKQNCGREAGGREPTLYLFIFRPPNLIIGI